MKKRLFAFITVLFILFLASNCAGVKHSFNTVITPGPTPPLYMQTTRLLSQDDNYSYAPASAEANGTFFQGYPKYKVSLSLPATVIFEF